LFKNKYDFQTTRFICWDIHKNLKNFSTDIHIRYIHIRLSITSCSICEKFDCHLQEVIRKNCWNYIRYCRFERSCVETKIGLKKKADERIERVKMEFLWLKF